MTDSHTTSAADTGPHAPGLQQDDLNTFIWGYLLTKTEELEEVGITMPEDDFLITERVWESLKTGVGDPDPLVQHLTEAAKRALKPIISSETE